MAPKARLIVAHLGLGAQPLRHAGGRTVDTTTGSPGLSGRPMATRRGDVRAGAFFYLLRPSHEKMLYERAGLLGLPGISGGMRALQKSKDPPAAPRISAPDSRFAVWVTPTNEELMIARHTSAIVDGDA